VSDGEFKLMKCTQHGNYVRLMVASSFRYMGTITGISDLDSERWPNSHWRSVKVNSLKLLYGYNLQNNCRYLVWLNFNYSIFKAICCCMLYVPFVKHFCVVMMVSFPLGY